MAESQTEIADELKAFGRGELDRLKGILNTGSDHSRMVGRVLRAHLLVEITMRRQIEAENPKLGPLEPVGLSFDRLRKLFFQMDNSLSWAIAPIAALNRMRNKFAHRLDAEVAQEDLKPFVEFLREMTLSPDKLNEIQAQPAAMVEVFATIFGLLSGASALTTRKLAELESKVLREFLGPAVTTDEEGV